MQHTDHQAAFCVCQTLLVGSDGTRFQTCSAYALGQYLPREIVVEFGFFEARFYAYVGNQLFEGAAQDKFASKGE